MASSNEMAKHSDETPSCEPLINSVKLIKLPTKPTVAARLYFEYRWEELKALGKSGEEIYKICHSEYQMMADEHKLKWIRLAVEKTPSHLSYELEQTSMEEDELSKKRISALKQDDKKIFDQLDSIKNLESKSQPPKSLGYNLFSRQLVSSEKFRVLKTKDRDIQFSIHWNRLSEKEKDEFNVEAEKFNLYYPVEFSNYLKSFLPIEQQTVPAEPMDLDKGGTPVEDPGNISWTTLNQVIATEDSYLNLNLKKVIGKELQI